MFGRSSATFGQLLLARRLGRRIVVVIWLRDIGLPRVRVNLRRAIS